jgi:hypothetical protein
MARIKLGRHEAEEGDLPQQCIRCGAPQTLVKRKSFSWHPQWVYVLLLVGLLPCLIVALILTKRMTAAIPLCEQHKSYWLKRNAWIWGTCFIVAMACVGAFALVVQGAERKAPRGEDLSGLVCLGSTLAGLVWLVVAAVIQHLTIRPTQITDTSITLTNVSDKFVDAVDDYRNSEDEYSDSEWRRSRRRTRQRRPGDEQIYDPKARRRPREEDLPEAEEA